MTKNPRIAEVATRVRTQRTIDRRHPDASTNELATDLAASAPMSEPALKVRHTPGPWSVCDLWKDSYEVTARVPAPGGGQRTADTLRVFTAHNTDIYADDRGGHALANARLAAAAPEMLALLKSVRVAGLVCPMPIGAPGSEARARWCEQVRLMDEVGAVIARATGGGA